VRVICGAVICRLRLHLLHAGRCGSRLETTIERKRRNAVATQEDPGRTYIATTEKCMRHGGGKKASLLRIQGAAGRNR
jgi:hypothetical protein